jgi:antitoxin component YwqK of YwqJK toxin-antitoxin module
MVNNNVPLNGPHETFHANGRLSSRKNYKDGELEGLCEAYFENGQLRFLVSHSL